METAPFHLTLKVDDAARALAVVAHNPERRAHHVPILSCVVIKRLAGKVFEVASFGFDVQISTTVKAVGNYTAGAIALPLRSLAAIVAAADSDEITLEVDKEGYYCAIKSGDLTARIIPMKADDAPALIEIDPSDAAYRTIPLSENVLSWMLELTLPFVSTEETRYYLNGVAFELTESNEGGSVFRAVSTNGHMLGHRETSLAAPVKPFRGRPYILPREAAKAVHALAVGKQAMVHLDEKRAVIAFGDVVVRAKLIDGTFPDWRRVTPADFNAKLKLKVSILDSFGRLVRGLNRDGSAATKIAPEPGGISLSAAVVDGGEVRRCIVCERPDFEAFGVSAKLIRLATKALKVETADIDVKDPHGPMRITAPGTASADFVILMPMRI